METYKYFVTIGCIVLIWFLNRWRLRKYVNLARKIPSNKLHTWLGCGPILARSNTSNYINEYGRKYGENSIFWSGPFSAFLTFDPVSVRDILTSKQCSGKPTEYNTTFRSTSGKGLLLLNDPEWTEHRRVLNKAFSQKNLLSFIRIFNSESDLLIRRIDNDICIGKNQKNLLAIFREMTFSTITQTILTRKFEDNSKTLKKLTENLSSAVHYMTDLGFNLTMKFNVKILKSLIYKDAVENVKAVRDFIHESFEMNAKKIDNNSSCLADINGTIDYAINSFKEKKLQSNELEDEVLHLYVAAFETTSTVLYSIIILLAMHPEYQERLYEEISSVLYENDSTTEVPFEKLEQMVYMDMVINEAFRILPSIPQLIRCVHNGSVTLSNGITLPEGQSILIDLYKLHRNQKVWGPDADKFNPDNFLPANMEARDSYAFAPFAKGVRNCIGWKFALLSLKTTLAKLIKNYKFSTEFKYENLKIESFIVIKFVEHPPLTIEERR